MQKSIIAALVIGLAASAASGREASNVKKQYLFLTKTNTVQISAAEVAHFFGDQQTLDMCIAANWDGQAIAKGLQGRKIPIWLCTVRRALPPAERSAFALTVAQGRNKTTGIILLMELSPANRDPAVCAAVLALQDGSETNLQRYANLLHYATALSIERGKVAGWTELGLNDLVAWLLGGGANKSSQNVGQAKERVKVLAQSAVKRALRAKGQTFVSRNGVNPIEEAMKPVVVALNAPKLAGLEAALRGIGADIADIERSAAIWGPIVAEKDAIMLGDKPAHQNADGGIILLLGPAMYNKWVDEYNNGKK